MSFGVRRVLESADCHPREARIAPIDSTRSLQALAQICLRIQLNVNRIDTSQTLRWSEGASHSTPDRSTRWILATCHM